MTGNRRKVCMMYSRSRSAQLDTSLLLCSADAVDGHPLRRAGRRTSPPGPIRFRPRIAGYARHGRAAWSSQASYGGVQEVTGTLPRDVSWSPVVGNHRADAAVGEQLADQRVGHAAVDDVGLLDARHGADARLDLGDHAAGDGSLLDEGFKRRQVDPFDQALALVENACDVGEEDHLLGVE